MKNIIFSKQVTCDIQHYIFLPKIKYDKNKQMNDQILNPMLGSVEQDQEVLLVDQLYAKGYDHFKVTSLLTFIYALLKIIVAPAVFLMSDNLEPQLIGWLISIFLLSMCQSVHYWRVWRTAKQMHYFLKIAENMRHAAFFQRSQVPEDAQATHIHPNIGNYLNLQDRINDRQLRILSMQIKYHFLNEKLSINIPARLFFFIYQGLHIWGFFIFFSADEYQPAHHFLIAVIFLGTYQYLQFYSIVIIAIIAGPFLLIYSGFKYIRDKRRRRLITAAVEGSKCNLSKLKGQLNCKICMQDYQEQENISTLPCNAMHHFHSNCLKQWIRVSETCPLCRRQISVS